MCIFAIVWHYLDAKLAIRTISGSNLLNYTIILLGDTSMTFFAVDDDPWHYNFLLLTLSDQSRIATSVDFSIYDSMVNVEWNIDGHSSTIVLIYDQSVPYEIFCTFLS